MGGKNQLIIRRAADNKRCTGKRKKKSKKKKKSNTGETSSFDETSTQYLPILFDFRASIREQISVKYE